MRPLLFLLFILAGCGPREGQEWSHPDGRSGEVACIGTLAACLPEMEARTAETREVVGTAIRVPSPSYPAPSYPAGNARRVVVVDARIDGVEAVAREHWPGEWKRVR